MNEKIAKAIQIAIDIANNDYHGYAQDSRWGQDGDCSSWNIRIWELAGVMVRQFGATYTRNMEAAYIAAGFTRVYGVDLATGQGLLPGDVLLNTVKHAALYLGDYNGKARQIFQAAGNEKGGITGGQPGDQTGKEVYIGTYYNSPWDVILRYTKEDENMNPYREPTKTYPAGQTFRGNDASWFIDELRRRGHNLLPNSDVAGANTWAAIYKEQEKAGIQVGDADQMTRMVLKGDSGVVQILALQKENADLRARMAKALANIDNAATFLE